MAKKEAVTNGKTVLWEDRKRLKLFGLPWTFTKYTLYPDKLTIKYGFFTRRIDDVRLYRILDVSTVETLTQRLFGLGTLKLKTSDKSLGDFLMVNIKDPIMVCDCISEAAEAERTNKKVSTREFIGGSHDVDTDDTDGEEE